MAVVALFSPRTARIFAAEAAAADWDLRRVALLALSPAADAAVGPAVGTAVGRHLVAAAPTTEAMLTALARV